MATRKSVRLAEKGKDRAEERAREQETNRDNGRRASIGDVLGVTPKGTQPARCIQRVEKSPVEPETSAWYTTRQR